MKLWREPLVWLMTAARFLAAVYILIDPLPGLVWSVGLDIADGRLLLAYLKTGWVNYHSWDKIVDWFAYLAELAVASRFGFFLPMLGLMFYRLIGQLLFVITHKSLVFVFFPNLFEAAFFWLVLFYGQSGWEWLPYPERWLVIFLILKLAQEVWHHFLWPKYGIRRWRQFMLKRFRHRPFLAEFFSTDYDGRSRV